MVPITREYLIVAPVMGNCDGTRKVVNINPAAVFDVSQTRPIERVAAVAAELQPRPRV